ncbi:hypothetical protein F511_41745 [Dorcoceras hygrometricum]|uniref:Uncharacterized protein n=1 Tax=Dorcoceras hygrometricum TaxID=472368 RepID=A0A2Z7AXA7_9LAMI|nr:hypothetical protein F511_41745 [Dorcoceras hygrometricum]
MASRRLAPTSFMRKPALQTVGGGRSSITSMTGIKTPSLAYTRRTDEFSTDGNTSARWPEQVRSLATSPHDFLCITDSACKNKLVVVSVQYGPFYTYIPIRSTIIGKSRVAIDPIAMHTSWRSNSDIVSVTRVSMTFRVVRTNQYNQDLGLIHSTNGNHLESPNEGSSIDHQVTIHLHAQKITMFPTNETCSNDSAATQLQQLAFSDADFIFYTKIQIFSTRSKTLCTGNPTRGNSQRLFTRTRQILRRTVLRDKVLGKFQQILSQSSVQATNQQVRNLGRIRAIELLPDCVQTAGFVIPDFTPYL